MSTGCWTWNGSGRCRCPATRERCLDLARFLAAELAHNTWSEMLQVTLVGFGQDWSPRTRTASPTPRTWPARSRALNGRWEAVHAAMRAVDVDVLDGRLHDIVGDQWAPTVLLIAPHLDADPPELDELLAAMTDHTTRASVALVLADDAGRGDADRWQLRLDQDGTLSIPALGLELIAQQIPAARGRPARAAAGLGGRQRGRTDPARARRPTLGPLRRRAWWPDRPRHRTGDSVAPTEHPADVADGSADDNQAGGVNPDRVTDAPAAPTLHLADDAPPRANSVLPLSPQTYLESVRDNG